MTIRELRVLPLRRPLRRPLATSFGAILHRDGWLVCAVHESGLRGFGEASPLPAWGTESAGRCSAELARAAERSKGRSVQEARRSIERAGFGPVARAALDQALWDLEARLRGEAMGGLLAGQPAGGLRARIAVNALLAEEEPGRLEREAAARAAEGHATLKLKVGALSLARDVERVGAARRGAGAGVALRLDANGAWDVDEAERRLRSLERFDLELVEQPVPVARPQDFRRLRGRVGPALAADEALAVPGAAQVLLDPNAVDALVLKPAALGGPGPASGLAARAQALGIGVIVTTLLEGTIAVAGALQLAAGLREPLHACGLATADLLVADAAPCLPVERGALAVPAGPGLGLEPCL